MSALPTVLLCVLLFTITLSSSLPHSLVPDTTMLSRWGFVHIAQCKGFVTNDSNHWILRQPDQVSKTDTMARGTRGPICGNQ